MGDDEALKVRPPQVGDIEGVIVKILGPTANLTQPITDNVHFSVTAPRTVLAGMSFILDVWAYLEQARQEVLNRATESQGGREIRIRSKGPVQVERNTTCLARVLPKNVGPRRTWEVT